MNLRILLPRGARCTFQRPGVDGAQRRCPHQVSWFARLFGVTVCLQHEELPDLD